MSVPAIRGANVIATIFSIIGSFQLFNEPNIMRKSRAELDHDVLHAQYPRSSRPSIDRSRRLRIAGSDVVS